MIAILFLTGPKGTFKDNESVGTSAKCMWTMMDVCVWDQRDSLTFIDNSYVKTFPCSLKYLRSTKVSLFMQPVTCNSIYSQSAYEY